MLEHMSPVDYAVVRTALGHGAGFDSPGFRGVHHVSPLLGEAFDALLAHGAALAASTSTTRGHEHEDLYQLAEQLITWDERAILWRFHHLKVVERIIGGNVIGTQGTPVEVLGRRDRRALLPGAVGGPRRDHPTLRARRRRSRARLTGPAMPWPTERQPGRRGSRG